MPRADWFRSRGAGPFEVECGCVPRSGTRWVCAGSHAHGRNGGDEEVDRIGHRCVKPDVPRSSWLTNRGAAWFLLDYVRYKQTSPRGNPPVHEDTMSAVKVDQSEERIHEDRIHRPGHHGR